MNSLNGLKHEKGQNKNKNFRHSTTLKDTVAHIRSYLHCAIYEVKPLLQAGGETTFFVVIKWWLPLRWESFLFLGIRRVISSFHIKKGSYVITSF